MAFDLEKIVCYNCGCAESNFYDTENGFQYTKCSKCGLVYLNPRPTRNEIEAAHEMGMHKGENTIQVTGIYKKNKTTNYLKILGEFYKKDELSKENLTWLDIGCGFGELIEALKIFSNNKLQIIGSEPNVNKVNSCKKRNLNVEFINLDSHNCKYDFISLLNVYSHLPNPFEFIEKLIKHLKPGGELLIETGHSCHLSPKDHQKPYYAPDHLSFANKEIVEDMLKRLGFEIIQTEIYRAGQFPKITDIKGIAIQLVKILIRRGGRWSNFCAKHPNRDMYIRAKLKDNALYYVRL